MTPLERVAAIRAASEVHRFPTLVKITRLDGSVGFLDPTVNQKHLLAFLDRFSWTYLVKYRQGMSSTIHISDELRHVQYTPGAMGMIIGDKEDTYKELMRRVGIMYDSLRPEIQIPLARPYSSEAITFDKPHNGLIQGLTGGGENPSIGFSPDYAILSEYGLYNNYETFNGAFFPAINRRPNARCRIETTPGTYNSDAHKSYRAALEGKGRFKALFLSWWRDTTCVSHDPPKPRKFQRTPEEDAYAKRVDTFDKLSLGKPWYPYTTPLPISDEHLWFRRIALETEFNGDTRLFDNKYPPSPFEGWLVSSSPTIPNEPLEAMRPGAIDVPEGTWITIEDPIPGCPYLLTVDGKGYGKSGDPAAIVLWNLWDWRAVGMYTGREDPGQLAPRVIEIQKKYNADVITEVNKDGVAAALQALKCPKLYWSDMGQPGWFSSAVSKKAAVVDLVNMLRAHEVAIPFAPILDQLASWDGKTRADGTGGASRHHWDLAICCLIFAFGVTALGKPRRPKPPPVEAPAPRGTIRIEDFDAAFRPPVEQNVLGMW